MVQSYSIIIPRRNLNYRNIIGFHFPSLLFARIIMWFDVMFSKNAEVDCILPNWEDKVK